MFKITWQHCTNRTHTRCFALTEHLFWESNANYTCSKYQLSIVLVTFLYVIVLSGAPTEYCVDPCLRSTWYIIIYLTMYLDGGGDHGLTLSCTSWASMRRQTIYRATDVSDGWLLAGPTVSILLESPSRASGCLLAFFLFFFSLPENNVKMTWQIMITLTVI